MTPKDFSRLQDRLGLNDSQMAEALGLVGKNAARSVRRFKTYGVPEEIARKAIAMLNMNQDVKAKADQLLADLRELRRQRDEWTTSKSPSSELHRLNGLITDREGQLEALGVDHA